MTLTIALTLALALSSSAQAPFDAAQARPFDAAQGSPAGRSAVPQTPGVGTPAQPQQPAQPADPKPVGTTGIVPTTPPPIDSPEPAPTPALTPAAQAPLSISRSSETVVILDRIELLLSRAQGDEKTLKSAGKVTMDRADVDEIIAELRQLKLMLQK